MQTETIDRLFLELAQFTQATTARETRLQARISELEKAIRPFAQLVHETNGRIPHERLSAADWHALAKAASPLSTNEAKQQDKEMGRE